MTRMPGLVVLHFAFCILHFAFSSSAPAQCPGGVCPSSSYGGSYPIYDLGPPSYVRAVTAAPAVVSPASTVRPAPVTTPAPPPPAAAAPIQPVQAFKWLAWPQLHENLPAASPPGPAASLPDPPRVEQPSVWYQYPSGLWYNSTTKQSWFRQADGKWYWYDTRPVGWSQSAAGMQSPPN
jgi:hypothetical protein